MSLILRTCLAACLCMTIIACEDSPTDNSAQALTTTTLVISGNLPASGGEISATTTVTDADQFSKTLGITLTKREMVDIWDWGVNILDNTSTMITGGESGIAAFDANGDFISFLYTDGGDQISVRLKDRNSTPLSLIFDPTTILLTQKDAPQSLSLTATP